MIYSQSHPILSSNPGVDFVNPGVTLKLFEQVVPLGHSESKTLQKIHESSVEAEATKEDLNEQKGEGSSNSLIEHSFLHPRPVKTETIELFNEQTKKRKASQQDKDITRSKVMKMKHKFQFV